MDLHPPRFMLIIIMFITIITFTELIIWTVPWLVADTVRGGTKRMWVFWDDLVFADIFQSFRDLAWNLTTINYLAPFSLLHVPSICCTSLCQLTCRKCCFLNWCQACPVIPESWNVMSKRLRVKPSGDWTRPSAHDRSRVVSAHEGARRAGGDRIWDGFECFFFVFFLAHVITLKWCII